MRKLLTGVDADGRSYAVEETELTFAEGGPGVGIDELFATQSNPPDGRPPGNSELLDLGVEPGLARWLVVEYGPDVEFHMHYTASVDFDIVLSGSLDLTLGDGVHHLEAGDCVVMTGVDHAWRSGPEGCRLSVVVLGSGVSA